ncbi:MAG: hypothetical protein ACYCSQ_00840 [bacterium]
MPKKLIFLLLLSSLFLFAGRAYAVSPTTTYALSGTLTATNSSGISFFALSGSSEAITGLDEASGSISYSSGFSGSISINGTTLSGSGDTINGITYDSSSNSFLGSIPLSLSQTLTQSATCSDGSTPSAGSCSNGAYLTCLSGYSLSGSTCSETVSGSFTLLGSGSNINISGGNSSGFITMTQTQDCPTGYTLSSGTCVATAQAGTTSAFECTDNGSEYQGCVSGSMSPSGASAELCPYSQTACTQSTATPSCPSGYTWNGTTCSQTSYTCPSGGTLSGTTCSYTATATETCPSGYTYNSSTGECTETTTQIQTVSACPSGYSWNGSTCEEVVKSCPSTINKCANYMLSAGPCECTDWEPR